jgi:hypothetical protein
MRCEADRALRVGRITAKHGRKEAPRQLCQAGGLAQVCVAKCEGDQLAGEHAAAKQQAVDAVGVKEF